MVKQGLSGIIQESTVSPICCICKTEARTEPLECQPTWNTALTTFINQPVLIYFFLWQRSNAVNLGDDHWETGEDRSLRTWESMTEKIQVLLECSPSQRNLLTLIDQWSDSVQGNYLHVCVSQFIISQNRFPPPACRSLSPEVCFRGPEKKMPLAIAFDCRCGRALKVVSTGGYLFKKAVCYKQANYSEL